MPAAVNRASQHSNNSDIWETPPDVFDTIDEAFDREDYWFGLDVAASDSNALLQRYYTEKQNALIQSWAVESPGDYRKGLWFCNPPYSLKVEFLLKAWVEFEQGHEGIMLLPSSQEAMWFRKYITHQNLPRLVWPGRIQFLINGQRMTRIDKNGKTVTSGNTGGSVLVAFMKEVPPSVAGEPWVR